MSKRYYSLSEIVFQPKPKTRNFKDLQGMRFSRFVVFSFSDMHKQKPYWFCQCDCGKIKRVCAYDLTSGHIKSCGCFRSDSARQAHLGLRSIYTKESDAYYGAKARCTNPKNDRYSEYGGRGIEFRFNSFEDFIEILGAKPTERHSLDRIDVNGHYEPGNVRWATPNEQANNTRTNKYVDYMGERLTVAQLVRKSIHNYDTVANRLRSGYCVECAINLPIKQSCQHRGVSHA